MDYYILTPSGYTYLKRSKNLLKEYKIFLKEFALPENKTRIILNDFLFQNYFLRVIEKKDLPDLKKLKRFLKKDNPTEKIDEIKFELNISCNMLCPHCYLNGLSPDTRLELGKVTETIDSCINLGINAFSFTGGEPTLYPDFGKLLNFLKQKKDTVTGILYTNGWWGTEDSFTAFGREFKNYVFFIRELLDSGFRKLVLSIDGIGRDHDEFRGFPGLYERNINIIEYFTNAGGKVFVQSILTPKNARYALEMMDILKGYKVSGINLGIQEMIGVKNAPGRIREEDISKLRKKYPDLIWEHKVKPRDLPKQCPFAIKPETIWVKADASVTPCCWIQNEWAVYGNLRENNIIDILNNIHNTEFYKLHKNKAFRNLKRKIKAPAPQLRYRTQCGPCSCV